MKYLTYVFIMFWTLIRKILGLPLFWIVVYPNWIRKYARNVVFNYKLQNGLWLKRLHERTITKVDDGWTIETSHSNMDGFVKYRKVYWLEYVLVYWLLWGWMDDDANFDTCDLGYIRKVISGEHNKPISKFLFSARMQRFVDKMNNSVYGNTFDLGNYRNDIPLKDFVCSWLWNVRNTAYNFKYDQYETTDSNKVFLFTIGSKRFGWVPTDIIDDKQNYHLVFWE